MKTKVTRYYKIVQLKCVKKLQVDFVLMYGLVNSTMLFGLPSYHQSCIKNDILYL